ncbi:conserved oligomeric Golgi complex subunit 8 [Ciona intestinalis]
MDQVPSHVDIDDESILTSIFKNDFRDEEIINPEFFKYLATLCSFDVGRLSHEPVRLDVEKQGVLESTQNLAFHNYKTFIRTAKCSKDIYDDFSLVETRLQGLIEKMPQFADRGGQFIKEATDIVSVRQANSLTLTRHTGLLEILEIPQLMDTCVRNQYYEDALELMFFVKRFGKKLFVSDIPALNTVIGDVQRTTQLMLEQLLNQLHSTLSLPACLKTVGFIRRLDCFSEVELRVKFLQARNSWLDGLLAVVPSGGGELEAFERITRIIEVCRVHLFDIVTQYRAIFTDDMDVYLVNKSEDASSANIFYCWMNYRVNCFLKSLDESLEIGVGTRLDSLLGQCMYFGQSFSRVGADFRNLLIKKFHKVYLKIFTEGIEVSTRHFHTNMMSYSFTATTRFDKPIERATSVDKSEAPPVQLLEYPPLAEYVNGVLSLFNNFRVGCPVFMLVDIPILLDASLIKVAESIAMFYKTEESGFSERELSCFVLFCDVFKDTVIPHLNSCLASLFPNNSMTELLGSTSVSLRSCGDVTVVRNILPAFPDANIETTVEETSQLPVVEVQT